jgi:hydrogenase maturation factor
MSNDKMTQNMEYIKKEFDTLLNLYRNKYILVHEGSVVSSFDTYEAAAEEGINTYGIEGDFLVYMITEHTPINFVKLAAI